MTGFVGSSEPVPLSDYANMVSLVRACAFTELCRNRELGVYAVMEHDHVLATAHLRGEHVSFVDFPQEAVFQRAIELAQPGAWFTATALRAAAHLLHLNVVILGRSSAGTQTCSGMWTLGGYTLRKDAVDLCDAGLETYSSSGYDHLGLPPADVDNAGSVAQCISFGSSAPAAHSLYYTGRTSRLGIAPADINPRYPTVFLLATANVHFEAAAVTVLSASVAVGAPAPPLQSVTTVDVASINQLLRLTAGSARLVEAAETDITDTNAPVLTVDDVALLSELASKEADRSSASSGSHGAQRGGCESASDVEGAAGGIDAFAGAGTDGDDNDDGTSVSDDDSGFSGHRTSGMLDDQDEGFEEDMMTSVVQSALQIALNDDGSLPVAADRGTGSMANAAAPYSAAAAAVASPVGAVGPVVVLLVAPPPAAAAGAFAESPPPPAAAAVAQPPPPPPAAAANSRTQSVNSLLRTLRSTCLNDAFMASMHLLVTNEFYTVAAPGDQRREFTPPLQQALPAAAVELSAAAVELARQMRETLCARELLLLLPPREAGDALLEWSRKKHGGAVGKRSPATRVQSYMSSPGSHTELRIIKAASMHREGQSPLVHAPAFVLRSLAPYLPVIILAALRHVVATVETRRKLHLQAHPGAKRHTVVLCAYPDGGRSQGESRLQLILLIIKSLSSEFLAHFDIDVVVEPLLKKRSSVTSFHKDAAKPKTIEQATALAEVVARGLFLDMNALRQHLPLNADGSDLSLVIFDDDSFSGATAEACLLTCERDFNTLPHGQPRPSCSTAVLFGSYAYHMYYGQKPNEHGADSSLLSMLEGRLPHVVPVMPTRLPGQEPTQQEAHSALRSILEGRLPRVVPVMPPPLPVAAAVTARDRLAAALVSPHPEEPPTRSLVVQRHPQLSAVPPHVGQSPRGTGFAMQRGGVKVAVEPLPVGPHPVGQYSPYKFTDGASPHQFPLRTVLAAHGGLCEAVVRKLLRGMAPDGDALPWVAQSHSLQRDPTRLGLPSLPDDPMTAPAAGTPGGARYWRGPLAYVHYADISTEEYRALHSAFTSALESRALSGVDISAKHVEYLRRLCKGWSDEYIIGALPPGSRVYLNYVGMMTSVTRTLYDRGEEEQLALNDDAFFPYLATLGGVTPDQWHHVVLLGAHDVAEVVAEFSPAYTPQQVASAGEAMGGMLLATPGLTNVASLGVALLAAEPEASTPRALLAEAKRDPAFLQLGGKTPVLDVLAAYSRDPRYDRFWYDFLTFGSPATTIGQMMGLKRKFQVTTAASRDYPEASGGLLAQLAWRAQRGRVTQVELKTPGGARAAVERFTADHALISTGYKSFLEKINGDAAASHLLGVFWKQENAARVVVGQPSLGDVPARATALWMRVLLHQQPVLEPVLGAGSPQDCAFASRYLRARFRGQTTTTAPALDDPPRDARARE